MRTVTSAGGGAPPSPASSLPPSTSSTTPDCDSSSRRLAPLRPISTGRCSRATCARGEWACVCTGRRWRVVSKCDATSRCTLIASTPPPRPPSPSHLHLADADVGGRERHGRVERAHALHDLQLADALAQLADGLPQRAQPVAVLGALRLEPVKLLLEGRVLADAALLRVPGRCGSGRGSAVKGERERSGDRSRRKGATTRAPAGRHTRGRTHCCTAPCCWSAPPQHVAPPHRTTHHGLEARDLAQGLLLGGQRGRAAVRALVLQLLRVAAVGGGRRWWGVLA
jgi:hypothetical protein